MAQSLSSLYRQAPSTAAGMSLVLTPAGYLAKSMKRDRIRVQSAEELHAGTLARPAVEMSEGEQVAIFAQIKRAIDEVTS